MKIEGTTMKLGEMPFYWRIKKSQKEIHDFLPSRMSYSFEFLPDLDLIQHKPTKLLLQNLEKMYLENSNIGFLQDGHNLAKGYGEDFYKFIKLTKGSITSFFIAKMISLLIISMRYIYN